MKNRYFKVVTKCGHVGRYNCIWINFAIVAESKQQVADKVREEGRVKRDHKDFIKEIKEISFEEFMELKAQNDADPYLHCKNIQEQNQIVGFEERIDVDEYNLAKFEKKTSKRDSVKFRKSKAKAKERSYTYCKYEFYEMEYAI
jgi:hypothetical protein